MSPSMSIGLACGLASALISEAVLRLGAPLLKRHLFRALAAGIALRSLWVLACAGWALSSGEPGAASFVVVLLLGYLAAQVFEGIRYQRYFEQC